VTRRMRSMISGLNSCWTMRLADRSS